jgi:hypothetical protein
MKIPTPQLTTNYESIYGWMFSPRLAQVTSTAFQLNIKPELLPDYGLQGPETSVFKQANKQRFHEKWTSSGLFPFSKPTL